MATFNNKLESSSKDLTNTKDETGKSITNNKDDVKTRVNVPSPEGLKLFNHALAGANISSIPEKYREHRKTSLPFADREPKVGFAKTVEPHSDRDHGEHVPLAPPKFKPILKPDVPPHGGILEPAIHLTSQIQGTESKIIAATSYVQEINQLCSSAQREIRGCLDILTFPAINFTKFDFESLARYKYNLIISIIAIKNFKSLQPSYGNEMKEIVQITESLLSELRRLHTQSKRVLKKSQLRYNQWKAVLNTSGEFKVEHKKCVIPIYSNNQMPENVSLYENDIENDAQFRTDGCIKVFRYTQKLLVAVESRGETFKTYQDNMDYHQTLQIAFAVVEHSKQLVFSSNNRLEIAFGILNNSLFDSEITTLKNKILNGPFDSTFDPLSTLELKTALTELSARKGELLNTVEHVAKYVDWMCSFTKKFFKYCKKTGRSFSTNTGSRICNCGPSLTEVDLFSEISTYEKTDFMITMPLTNNFFKTFLKLEAVESKSKSNSTIAPGVSRFEGPIH